VADKGPCALTTEKRKKLSAPSVAASGSTHLIKAGYDIRTIRELIGHKFLQTTMIYTHVASKNLLGVRSPLDR